MAVHPSRALTRIGTAAVATGIGHDLLGAWLYRRQLAGIARDGLVDAVENADLPAAERHRREVALWFLTSGAAIGTVGAALRGARATDGAVVPIGAGLTAMGVIGAAVLPRSGFWLLIGQGAAALSVARRARR
ncbi:DUF6463 family protein [Mycolicibacterium sediminis]|uniref:Uncharacterized protein n=1 Tax=Mycolicibacterium sediminis TaxID=1286180 RepID=A0A7I7QT00_9MYCO|nr:DUF6463 family protein [Mycolicibacterium sediminis]BBY29365.1 hypothetical protein MSEDJ_34610 [Mycolicibacterium sediminis]